MTDLLLHPETRVAIDRFIGNPSNTLLIVSPVGAGKGTIAKYIASQLLAADTDNLPADKVKEIVSDKPISIDEVRSVQKFLSLKTLTASDKVQRVLIMHDTQTMATDAQNAFLKTLEEVPADSVLILTSTSEHALLPTVLSRLQRLPYTASAKPDVIKYFVEHGYENSQVERAYAISGGAIGMMHALLEEGEDHPVARAATAAREFLSQTQFERLATIDVLAKDRVLAIDTCELLGQMAHLALKNPGLTPSAAKKWTTVMRQSMVTSEALQAYAQPKLALTSLALSV